MVAVARGVRRLGRSPTAALVQNETDDWLAGNTRTPVRAILAL